MQVSGALRSSLRYMKMYKPHAGQLALRKKMIQDLESAHQRIEEMRQMNLSLVQHNLKLIEAHERCTFEFKMLSDYCKHLERDLRNKENEIKCETCDKYVSRRSEVKNPMDSLPSL